MPSSFFELSVASTGLFTAKGALNVVSHNISNAATDGYSRQIALVKARNPINYSNGRGMVGTGSELYGVGQIRSFYLDTKYWTSTGRLGEYTAKNTQNMLLQSILNESDESGINVAFDKFFSTLNKDLAIDAGNVTSRTNVISNAQTLTTYLNSQAALLEKQQNDVNLEIKSMVGQINNLGEQILNLNKQIYTSEIGGNNANDLRDQRALIVDELSKFVNIEVAEIEVNKDLLTGDSEKRFQVMLNGQDFINHFSLNTLECKERTEKSSPGDVDGLFDIFWDSGVKLNSEHSIISMGGELKGLLMSRDGNNCVYDPPYKEVNYKGVPYFMSKLDTFAQGIARAFNLGESIHGDALYKNGYAGHYNSYNLMEGDNTGYNLFGYKGFEDSDFDPTNPNEFYDNITAKNFCVSQTLLDNPNALAAAWSPDGMPLNPDISDNSGLLQLTSLRHDPFVFDEGEFGNFIESITGELGIVASEAVAFASNYTDIQASVQYQRLSVSSVDLNEEMTNMIQLQQMYNACAKLVNVINGIYDTTINKMG